MGAFFVVGALHTHQGKGLSSICGRREKKEEEAIIKGGEMKGGSVSGVVVFNTMHKIIVVVVVVVVVATGCVARCFEGHRGGVGNMYIQSVVVGGALRNGILVVVVAAAANVVGIVVVKVVVVIIVVDVIVVDVIVVVVIVVVVIVVVVIVVVAIVVVLLRRIYGHRLRFCILLCLFLQIGRPHSFHAPQNLHKRGACCGVSGPAVRHELRVVCRAACGDRQTLAAVNAAHHLHCVFSSIRDLSRQHFPQYNGERVHIGLLRVTLLC